MIVIALQKDILFGFIRSHSRLAQAERNRNPVNNNTHFSHIAEDKMSAELERLNLLDEFLIEE